MKIQIGEEIRDMSKEEKANYDAVVKAAAEFVVNAETIGAARQSAYAKLKALGLSDEEIAALVG